MTNRHGIPILKLNPQGVKKPRGAATQPKRIKPQKMKKKSPPVMTKKARLWIDGDGKCHYCGSELVSWKAGGRAGVLPRQKPTIDHKVARSRGGSSAMENLLLSCKACNERKSSMDYDIFVAHLRNES